MSVNFFFRRSTRVLSVTAIALGSAALIAGVGVAITSSPNLIDDELAAYGSALSVTPKAEHTAAPAAAVSAVASTPAIQAQLDYALAHWNNYNTEQFGDLNPVGGDCQNFVSQSLLARGWTMDAEWYSEDGGDDWGAPWGYVPAFDEYLRAHPELGATEASLDERSTIKIGDLVMFDWEGDGALDHVQIVSSITTLEGVITIGMAGHNTDSDYRDLDTTITVDHPGATAYFWRIP